MLKFFKLIKDEKGATAIEYGLIAALIAVAAVTAMTGLGQTIGNTFNNVSDAMEGYVFRADPRIRHGRAAELQGSAARSFCVSDACRKRPASPCRPP